MPDLSDMYFFQVSDESPTMLQLIKMRLPVRVRDQHETFSILLLHDDRGDRMAILNKKCRGDTREVLMAWLAGEGIKVSWESLISTLKDSGLMMLSQQILLLIKGGHYLSFT